MTQSQVSAQRRSGFMHMHVHTTFMANSSASLLTLDATTLSYWNLRNSNRKRKHSDLISEWAAAIPSNAKQLRSLGTSLTQPPSRTRRRISRSAALSATFNCLHQSGNPATRHPPKKLDVTRSFQILSHRNGSGIRSSRRTSPL